MKSRFQARSLFATPLAAIFTCLILLSSHLHAQETAPLEFFEKQIRPLLVTHCQDCHGPDSQESGLRVDSLEALLKGGEFGPAINPGKPEESLLISAVNHGEIVQMPPKTKLKAAQIQALTEWVKLGAPWPEAKVAVVPANPSSEKKTLFTPEQKSFWAFQSPKLAPLPAVQNSDWCQSPIDHFILAALEAKQILPAPMADKRTLIRRATFDLLGIPPTPAEVDSFLSDESPEAFARVIDRLLASPLYGQRWGRHWLDVARYADSNGMDENMAHANAYRYRDYVVSALNQDKPYDQFLQEQIAGDLLADPSNHPLTAERLIATGFLVIGPKMLAEDDPRKMEMDIVDEQLDTVGRTFLGLTFGCARCHDHKFDPLPTADYYSLAAIFKSTKTMENFSVVAMWHERSIASPAETSEHQRLAEIAKTKRAALDASVKKSGDAFLLAAKENAEAYLAAATLLHQQKTSPTSNSPPAEQLTLEKLATEKQLLPVLLQQWLAYLEKQPADKPLPALPEILADAQGPNVLPNNPEQYYAADVAAQIKQLRDESTAADKAVPLLPTAMSASEGSPTNLKVHLRGNYLTLDREVPRQFPQIISGESQAPIDNSRSGRLEFAQWMTQSSNPLTSRVIANRLWHWHFGNGLVRSPDNFGRLGELPDNPELLDWLALKLVEQNWSLKSLHRSIMLSSTYQMSSAYNADAFQSDPENRLHWRHDRKRLEAESLRDSVLSLSQQLDLTFNGTLLDTGNHNYVRASTSETYKPYQSNRRSIYLPITRSTVYELFQAFDFADPSTPNGQRATTTIAPQALALMNSKLLEDQTLHWAQQLVTLPVADDTARLITLYQQAYSRPPSEQEITRVLSFLNRIEGPLQEQKVADARTRAWQSLCRVILSSSEFIYVE